MISPLESTQNATSIKQPLHISGVQPIETRINPGFFKSATVAEMGCERPKRNPPCVYRHGEVAVPLGKWGKGRIDSWGGGVKTSPVHRLPKQKGHRGNESGSNPAVVHVSSPFLVAETEEHGITHPVSLRINTLNQNTLGSVEPFHCTPHAPNATRGAV